MIAFVARIASLASVEPKGEQGEPAWKMVLEVKPHVPIGELANLVYTVAKFEIIEGQSPLRTISSENGIESVQPKGGGQ